MMQNAEAALTPELSRAGPTAEENPRLPGKSLALPGVGSSDLVCA